MTSQLTTPRHQHQMFLRPLSRSASRSLRPYTVRNISKKHSSHIQTIPSCPSPTCACSESPEMPEGFPIDRTKPLNGTMAAYAEQLIICTGKDDWDSRIEDENGGDNLAARIKKLVGPKGEFHDPYHPISIINSSLDSTKYNEDQSKAANRIYDVPDHTVADQEHIPTPNADKDKPKFVSAYLFPSFKYIPYLPTHDSGPDNDDGIQLSPTAALKSFAQTHLVPHNSMKFKAQSHIVTYAVNDVLVLICGHGGRDVRCGILGPLLRDEFRTVLASNTSGPLAKVGLISHIGGHKFAGNVIVYLPPGMKKGGGAHPLAGCGIWYGRVEPKHVEGIVRETIFGGRVIQDMFRGGIRQGGEIIRM